MGRGRDPGLSCGQQNSTCSRPRHIYHGQVAKSHEGHVQGPPHHLQQGRRGTAPGINEDHQGQNLVKPLWGKQVTPQDVIIAKKSRKEEKTPSWMVGNCRSFTQKHVNYQHCTTTEGLLGIYDVDKMVPYCNPDDEMEIRGYASLRQDLYSQLQLSDGTSLIAEVHQKQALGHVEVVIPSTKEAEAMVAMMNKNVPAYLTFYTKDLGMDMCFIHELLNESCDPTLIHATSQCKWDSKMKMLETPQDLEAKKEKQMEDANFYVDIFGQFMKGKKEEKVYIDPENMFDLDGEASVKSIWRKPADADKKPTRYGGSPGAPIFQVGGKKKQEGVNVETVESDSDDMEEVEATANASANFATLSREELIARLQKANISHQSTGSAPNNGKRSHSKSHEEEEDSSSSNGSLALGSSSGSSAESTEGGLDETGSG